MRVLAVAAALLLAGCASPAATEALLPALFPGLAEATVAAFNAVVDPAGGQGEPSVGVHPGGSLWTHGVSDGPVLGRGGGTVYRSDDAGLTWSAVAAPNDPIPDLDPDLAVDKDGTIWDDVLYLGCNSVAVSRDEGATWTRHPAVCNLPVGDRQYVVPTEGGEAYLYYHQLPTFQQTAMKTMDHGRTWIPLAFTEGLAPHHLLVNEGSGWGGGGFWNEATGSVWFTYTWFEGGLGEGAWRPAASVTRDGGLTWSVVGPETAGGGSIGLSLVVGAADADGVVYLAWAETLEDGGTGVFLASSEDDGETWSAPKRVDRGVGATVLPAIAATGPGDVVVAYYETTEVAYPTEASDDALWNVTLAWTMDAASGSPAWTYGRLSEAPAKKGPLCPDGSSCGEDRELLDYFQVKILADGRAVAVWTSTEVEEGAVLNVVGATREALFR